jgi:hypothetical protein
LLIVAIDFMAEYDPERSKFKELVSRVDALCAQDVTIVKLYQSSDSGSVIETLRERVIAIAKEFSDKHNLKLEGSVYAKYLALARFGGYVKGVTGAMKERAEEIAKALHGYIRAKERRSTSPLIS